MRKDRTYFKAYVTKYALTTGICAISAEDCFDISVDMIGDVDNKIAYYHKGQWHLSMEDAVVRAESMRIAKIANLRKSIAKLERLRFSGATP